MRDLLERILRAADRAGVEYAVLRDVAGLADLGGRGEVDLLVRADHLDRWRGVLAPLGFADLDRRGHAPHHFFAAYDPACDGWLKLDVVTAVAYGAPYHALATDLADGCLRRRLRRGAVFALAPEDELVTLLLHCLLDKVAFAPKHRARLGELVLEAAPDAAAGLLAILDSPGLAWPRVRAAIEAGAWDDLLTERAAVTARLAGRDPLGTRLRGARDRALRRWDRLRQLVRPRLPAVALLAPDGAGKSTLAEGLARSFYFGSRQIYMGLYQKDARRSALARFKGLGVVGHVLTQWRRYAAGRFHRGRGRLVVFDRYTYDAYLPAQGPESASRRLRRWILAHACPAPDLVVLLDAPGHVLYARKGEHSPARLEAQRRAYLDLRARAPGIVVVDATQDPDRVRRDVLSLIWRRYAARGPRWPEGEVAAAAVRLGDGASSV